MLLFAVIYIFQYHFKSG